MDKDRSFIGRAVECLKERRLPWRLEYFIKRNILFKLFGNPNTKEFWNKKLSEMEGERWRDYVYFDLVELLPKDGNFSLLDVGCALGDGCVYLKEKFPAAKISGCDFSDQAIALAKKKKSSIEFFVHDIILQDITEEYDYITLVSILEHFDDPYKIIDKCLKRARKALIISCPYAKSITYDIKDEHRFAFNENSLKDYEHKYNITADKREPNQIRIVYIVNNKKA